MLGKLIKYDLKSLLKTMTPMYIILILLSLLNRLAYYASDAFSILNIPAGFILAGYIILMITLPIASFVVTIIRYYNNLARDEGYLMHTLPVTKKALVMSKLITACFIMCISVLVSGMALIVGSYGIYFDSDIFMAIKQIFPKIDSILFLLGVTTIIISVVTQQLFIYASISLGQMHNSNKVAYSFVYGIVLYAINQGISMVFMLIPTLLNKDWTKYLNQTNPPLDIMRLLLLESIITSVFLSIAYYIVAVKAMDKKLNLQ